MSNTTPTNRPCGNCEKAIPSDAVYCVHCGQKSTDGRISIASFFSVFFSTVFNLESKFFQTMKDIFVPGKLTIEYFKGRHKRYFHPVRLFIVSALLLIGVWGYQMGGLNTNFGDLEEKAKEKIYNKAVLADLDSLSEVTALKFPEHNTLPIAFDSLYQAMNRQIEKGADSVDFGNYIVLYGEGDFSNKKIANDDFIQLSPEEITDKYGIKGFANRLFFRQKIKLLKDRGNFLPFLLGNTLWIVLAMMPFLALILKLLYLRHNYYYVEHLIFSFHAHSFAFVLLIITSLLNVWFNMSWLNIFAFLVLFIYLYKAMRKVYMQGRAKTLIKLLVVNFVYLLLFSIFITGGLLIGMALF